MATTLTSVSVRGKLFHPNYAFRKHPLYWNTGSGYETSQCLNADGDVAFSTSGTDTNYYIGEGRPNEAQQSTVDGSLASALVEMKGGHVEGPSRTQHSNTWTVANGRTFEEYDQAAMVNNQALGVVKINTVDGALSGSSLSWKKVGDSSVVLPKGGNYATSRIDCLPSGEGSFVCWWRNGSKVTFVSDLDSVDYSDLVAVFGIEFKVIFKANGGSGTIPTTSYFYGVDDYVPQGKIPSSPYKRSGYSFAGWNTEQDGSGHGVPADSNAADLYRYAVKENGSYVVRIYAQWVCVKIRKRGTGEDAGTDVDSVGTLTVTHLKDNGALYADQLVDITETVNGVQRKAWIFAPAPNKVYNVSLSLGDGDPDRLFAFAGLTDKDGQAVAEFATGPTVENGVLNANFTRKVLKIVKTSAQMLGGEDFDGSGFPEEITMSVTYPAEPDTPTDGKYLLGTPIVATPNYPLGADGWHLYGFRLDYFDDNGESLYSSAVFSDAQFIAGDKANVPGPNFTNNMTVVGLFARDKFSATRKVDTPSASAISDFRALVYDPTDEEWADINVLPSRGGKVRYNETVRLVKTVESGFIFDGFYANGEKIAAEVQHDDGGDYDYVPYVVRGPVEFVAKAAVSVKMAIEHWDNRPSGSTQTADNTCVISVDGEEAASHDLAVVLGDTINYAVVLGNLANIPGSSKWKFDAWYAADDLEAHGNPLALPSEDAAFEPTSALDIVARVVAVEFNSTFTVGFRTVDANGVIAPVAANGDWVDSNPASASKTVDPSGNVELSYVGTKSVELTLAESVVGAGGKAFAFTKVMRVKNDGATEELFSSDLSFRLLTNRSLSLVAYYGEDGSRTIGVALANDSDRTMGTVAIVSVGGGTIEAGDQSATVPVGQKITFRAVASNGYRFAGWYYSAAHDGNPKYADTEVTATVVANRTLYAYFVQDTRAVYEWEGRSDNKMMTWRSKVYVAQVPFNPSAIRVDATDSRGRGTAVNRVEVGMMSSPDSAPAQSGLAVLLNMPNYVARRLPKRRPERYLYVEVQSDAEVDRIIVGTSMEGLRV